MSHQEPTERHAASFEIQNRLGLHARAAALLAETANRFQSQVTISKDGRSALVQFDMRGDAESAGDRVAPVLKAVDGVQKDHETLRIEEIGSASMQKTFDDAFGDDFQKAEFTSLPVTLLILVLAFGAFIAAGVPLLLGLTAVGAAIGLTALVSHITPMSDAANSVILLIGLAVGVDYSLFYLRREREERAAGRSESASLEAAAATSGMRRTLTPKRSARSE